jgi:hypothetical protein
MGPFLNNITQEGISGSEGGFQGSPKGTEQAQPETQKAFYATAQGH